MNIDDPSQPAFWVVEFVALVVMMYGFGQAVMFALGWLGDRPLRPIIAYSLTIAGASIWPLRSHSLLGLGLIVGIGVGCMAVQTFAAIGRGIPDEKPPPDEELDEDPDDDDWDEDDGLPDSR